ncbi:MAG: ComF family protein, partial [Deltaproteobacteria bacterium]
DDCKSLPPKVILVDDVFTTGETVRRCASVLKERGVKLVFVWALFRTIPQNEGLEMASSFRGSTQKKSN